MASRLFIVTGANKGIGFETAKKLCRHLNKENAAVVITSRCLIRGRDAVAKLAEEGLTASAEQLDITDPQSIKGFVETIKNKYNHVECLVNNAGFMFKPFAKEPLALRAQVTCDVNYFGTRNLSRAISPLFTKNSRVINVASTEAQKALKEMSAENRHRLMSKQATIECTGESEPPFSSSTSQDIDSAIKDYLQACGKNDLKGWSKNTIGVAKAAVIAMTAACARVCDRHPEKEMIFTCCCPGWCKTDLGGEKAPLSAADGAEIIAPLALGASKEHHGKFVRKGEILDLRED
ncbi:hypothetical protein Emag_001113 [Eimeria magna]